MCFAFSLNFGIVVFSSKDSIHNCIPLSASSLTVNPLYVKNLGSARNDFFFAYERMHKLDFPFYLLSLEYIP